jgi:hypothetical protein
MSLVDDFIHASDGEIPSLPANNGGTPTRKVVPSAIAGAAAGVLTYVGAPQIIDIPTQGIQDEALATSVGLFTFFVSSLVAPRLCSTKREQKNIEKMNVAAGVGSGAMAGAGLAIGLHTLDVLTTGGIITALALVTGGSALLYNKFRKVKSCHSCDHQDSCEHIVCRNCYNLHVPMQNPLNCEATSKFLTWYRVASQLHTDGLNYLESLDLARDSISKWRPYYDKNGKIFAIDCKQFREWYEKNGDHIAKYKNSVRSPWPESIKKDTSHIKALEETLKGAEEKSSWSNSFSRLRASWSNRFSRLRPRKKE